MGQGPPAEIISSNAERAKLRALDGCGGRRWDAGETADGRQQNAPNAAILIVRGLKFLFMTFIIFTLFQP